MTILKSAYDTTVGRIHPQLEADTAIAQAIIAGSLASDTPVVTIERVKDAEILAIPQLIYPKVLLASEQERVFIDVRPVMGVSTGVLDRKILNRVEYDMRMYWASYQSRWVTELPRNLLSVSPVPLAAYATWVSGSIIKRLSMDFHQIIPIRVIAAFYYCCQFFDGELEEPTRLSIYGQIARALNLTRDVVFEILGDGAAIGSLKDLVQMLQTQIASPRLAKLSPGFLIQMTAGSWFGIANQETTAAALEHPPTWLTLVTAAMNNTAYRSTQINRAIEQVVGKSNYREVAITLRRASGVERLAPEHA